MRIRTIKHRGLKRFVEDNEPREIRGDLINRVRNILAALVADQTGTWSISASENWRITFAIEDGEIVDLNLEDYH